MELKTLPSQKNVVSGSHIFESLSRLSPTFYQQERKFETPSVEQLWTVAYRDFRGKTAKNKNLLSNSTLLSRLILTPLQFSILTKFWCYSIYLLYLVGTWVLKHFLRQKIPLSVFFYVRFIMKLKNRLFELHPRSVIINAPIIITYNIKQIDTKYQVSTGLVLPQPV